MVRRIDMLVLLCAATMAQGATVCTAVPSACAGTFSGSSISLFGDSSVSGTLPAAIAQLTNLTVLILGATSISGTVPTDLAQLTQLTYLDLDGTSISGTMPTDLAQLTQLTKLSLAATSISGTVPTDLAQLTQLAELYLYTTPISGTVPTDLAHLTQLAQLFLGSTSISGTVPTDLAQLTQLTGLGLGATSISGTVPTDLAQLAQLTQLSLDATSISGTVPTDLAQLTQLTTLDLDTTSISGTVPTDLAQLTQLTVLNLNSTVLSGTIPSALGLLTNLAFLNIRNNAFSGILPPSLGRLSLLGYFDASSNHFTYPTAISSQQHTDCLQATARCRADGTTTTTTDAAICLGLPPVSCSAFANNARLALTNPDACVACSGNDTAYVALLIVAALAALAAFALFTRYSVRHPHTRKQWVSSVLLLVTHTQSLSLLGYLRLDWPPAVRWLIDDVLSFNVFNVPSATCVFGSPHSFEALTFFGSSVSSAYTLSSLDVYAFAAIGAPLLILLSLLITRTVASWRGKADAADRAELALTLAFSLLLSFGWSVIASVINKTALAVQAGERAASAYAVMVSLGQSVGLSWDSLNAFSLPTYNSTLNAVIALHFALIAALLLLLLSLFVHFTRNIRRYRHGLTSNIWRKDETSCWCACASTTDLKPIAPRRLAKQVAFLTGRFAPHAPRWQLVIWTRQLALFLVALVATITATSSTNSLGDRTYDDGPRYTLALADLLITLMVWFMHHRTQPYAYRLQNAVESRLYAATVVFLLLMIIYSAIPDTHAMSSLAIELLSVALLFGSLFGAAIYLAWRLRQIRQGLQSVDLGEALAAADAKLDASIRERLADGTIRLLKCDWLVSADANAALGCDHTHSKQPIILRRQDMPSAAYFSPHEAAALFDRGDRSVLVLSYGWHTGPHSDPHGLTLAKVRRYLRGDPSTRGCALFWDIASRPQPEQTDDEVEIGDKGLGVMSSFYASITGTCVIQQKEVPVRPPMYDGAIQLFGVAKELFEDGTADRLRESMAQFGTVVSAEIVPATVDLKDGAPRRAPREGDVAPLGKREIGRIKVAHAIVRFASHAEAEAAMAGLSKQGIGAATLYNATPYEGIGGRGWCVVEQGSSTVVAAHLAKAKESDKGLIERFERAEAARAKVIDITGDTPEERRFTDVDPIELLDKTMCELSVARFTFPSDKAMAEEMMAGFEWTIKSAMEQAELAQHADLLTVDPLVERRLLLSPQDRRASRPASCRRESMQPQVGGASGAGHDVEEVAVELT